jgi:hypothetical protein
LLSDIFQLVVLEDKENPACAVPLGEGGSQVALMLSSLKNVILFDSK